MAKRDNRGWSMVFDDSTTHSPEFAEEMQRVLQQEGDQPTIIDDGELGEEVAQRLRALRRELSQKGKPPDDPDHTAYMDAPTFDEDTSEHDPPDDEEGTYPAHEAFTGDGEPTTFDTPALGSPASLRLDAEEPDEEPLTKFDDADPPTAFDSIGVLSPPPLNAPKEEPPSPDVLDRDTDESDRFSDVIPPAPFPEFGPSTQENDVLEEPELPDLEELHPSEYTRKEPIPMELFLNPPEPEIQAFPESSRPPMPNLSRSPSVAPREETLLDVAAQLGVAPDLSPIDVDATAEDAPMEQPRLPLPAEEAERLDLDPFLEEEPPKLKPGRRPPARGIGGSEIRRLADATTTTAKIIPVIMVSFVLISVIVFAVRLFQSATPRKTAHVELRFLKSVQGKQVNVAAKEGAPMVRLNIETKPPNILVVHNRAILGKTPLTIDLPLDLGESAGVELSGPYYETWISQVDRDSDSSEYRIDAELIGKK